MKAEEKMYAFFLDAMKSKLVFRPTDHAALVSKETFASSPFLTIHSIITREIYTAREEGRCNTDHQHDRKSLERSLSQYEEEHGRKECRKIGVEDRCKCALITFLDRFTQFPALPELFPDAFIDKHVCIHGHTHGEHNAGNTGQREGRLKLGKDSEDKEYVEEERDCPLPSLPWHNRRP